MSGNAAEKKNAIEDLRLAISQYDDIIERLENAKDNYGKKFPPAMEKIFIALHSKLEHLREKKKEISLADGSTWKPIAKGAEQLINDIDEMITTISMQIEF